MKLHVSFPRLEGLALERNLVLENRGILGLIPTHFLPVSIEICTKVWSGIAQCSLESSGYILGFNLNSTAADGIGLRENLLLRAAIFGCWAVKRLLSMRGRSAARYI